MREQVLGEKIALWCVCVAVWGAAAVSAGVAWFTIVAAAVGLPAAVALAGRVFGAAVARATIAESEKYGEEQVRRVEREIDEQPLFDPFGGEA